MSELIKSLKKSIIFLRDRYPDGLALLTDLENLLESLEAKKEKTSSETSTTEGQGD